MKRNKPSDGERTSSKEKNVHGTERDNAQDRGDEDDEEENRGDEDKQDDGEPDENMKSAKENQTSETHPKENKRPAQPQDEKNFLTVKLSRSLYAKLVLKAQDEGISVSEFASELLAEGLVLRAWEIMERKQTMRGGQPQQNYGHNRQQGGRHHGDHRRGRGDYQAVMQDKAAFMEYVRNQERKRR